jgi:hypothetical protein
MTEGRHSSLRGVRARQTRKPSWDIWRFGSERGTADNGKLDLRVGGRTTFQMSMNLAWTDLTDPWFSLTVAHEFGHILTGQIEQLDRFSEPGDCDTFDNGEGCALPGSYLDDWVAMFWSEDELASLDVMTDDLDAADERCSLNAGFLGPYAATNPDEDFAESFSAFVFQVEMNNPELEDKMAFFDERPEMAEIRDRAEDSGFAGLPNQFEICG